jgi:two-component system OmpR family response regulator
MAKVLLIEDEPDLAKLIKDWLARYDHCVDVVGNGDEAMNTLRLNKNRYEIIILDLMLPGRSGLDVCKAYRANSGNAPVLMITAKDGIEDKEAGFAVGADDYMTKPFHLKELTVRIAALLRRSILLPSKLLKVRDIELDPSERTVKKSGNEVHLSPKEFHLLHFFMKHPNQVFSSDDLIESVWEPDTDAMNDTIRGHINRLRRKLDSEGQQSIISNVYGFGYKLESEII